MSTRQDSPVKIITAFSNPYLSKYLYSELNYNNVTYYKITAQSEYGGKLPGLITQEQPDIVIIGLILRDMGGIEAAENLLKKHPDLKIILASPFNDEIVQLKARMIGVKGIIKVDYENGQIFNVINKIFLGNLHFPAVLEELPDLPIAEPSEIFTGTEIHHIRALLTKMEIKIFCLMGRAKGKEEIQKELSISERTIGNHIYNINRKLKLNSTSRMICFATRYVLFKD